MRKKLTLILILTLALSLIPAYAFAEGGQTGDGSGTVQDSGDPSGSEDPGTVTVPNGWAKENGRKVYYRKGKKVIGWRTIDGKRYHFSKAGYMQTGMKRIGNRVYYLKNGVKTVKEGWVRVKGEKYYGYANGTYANKAVKIGKNVYMFRKNGKLIKTKGLFKYNGKWYYGKGNGKLKTGWVADGKKAMYFNKKNSKKTGSLGSMARNTTVGYLRIPKSGKLGYAYALGVQQLDKSGWSLYKAYTFSYKLRYGDRWYRRKTSEDYAIRGFTQGYGNCYVMAATFYIQAKLLGYDVHQVEGKVDLPHSWTVIIEDGREWVYDPNFTNETGRNGWKIYYGKKGTWRYNSFHKMN